MSKTYVEKLRLTRLSPPCPLMVRASELYHDFDYVNAVTLYTKLLLRDASNSDAYCAMANIKLIIGDHVRALHDYDLAIKLSSKYHHYIHYTASLLHNIRGKLLIKQHNYVASIVDYEKAIFYDHGNFDAYYYQGYAYFMQQKLDKADAVYQHLMQLSAHSTDYYPAYEYFKPVSHYKVALQLDYEFAEAVKFSEVECGLLNLKNNQDISDLEQLYKTAYQHSQLHNYQQAITCLEQALSIDDSNASLHFDLAMHYLWQQQYELAENSFNQALALNPTHGRAHYGLCKIHLAAGNLDLALTYVNTAIQLEADAHDYYHAQASNQHYNRAHLHLVSGRSDLAVTDFNKAIDLDKHNFAAIMDRAQEYAKRENYYQAMVDYHLVIEHGDDLYSDIAKSSLADLNSKMAGG